MQPSLVTGPGLFDFHQVLPERHFRLWLLQGNGLGYYADLKHFVSLHPWCSSSWDEWRTIHIVDDGKRLAWAHGATLDIVDLRMELRTSPEFLFTPFRRSVTTANFFRPLLHCVPSPLDTSATAERVTELYGISRRALRDLSGEYAAPSALLYRRLTDLCLALGDAFCLCEEEVRTILHGTWSSSPLKNRGPTPYAAIQAGELAYVEHTLYPHANARPLSL